jgi:O-methyltransferase
MSLFQKLFGSRRSKPDPTSTIPEPIIPSSPAPAPQEPAVPSWDPEAIIPLSAVQNHRELIALLKNGDLEQAFALLNSQKAARNRVEGTDYLRAHLFLAKQQPIAASEALKEELRFFKENDSAAAALQRLQARLSQTSTNPNPEFQELLQIVRPYTMVGEDRLFSLYQLAKEVCQKDLPGNFVECGVAAGGSSALLAAVVKRYSTYPRRIYSFDTFEGMPPATEQDAHLGTPADATGWGEGTCAAPVESLLELAGKLGVTDLITPVKGLFADTLPPTKSEIGAIAFLHVDGDWYSSTMDVMQNLYDQVLPGAPIQVDDYGFWDGCKRAIEEFQQQRGVTFALQKIDFTGVWFYRP